MSNYIINLPSSKTIQSKLEENKNPTKKAKSQLKYINAPDIMTQALPSNLNNFIRPINPHILSLTPSNHCNKLDNIEEFLLPPKEEEFIHKKTLILDLDETLVHSSFTPFEKNDIILDVDFEGVMYNIYVLIRPYAKEFLKNVSKYFEIVIFTASISKYASPLLDILDKEKNIKYRLYRDHCTYINGIFIKDLKKLNRCLKDVIIVDNSPIAYAFDTENGLPIKTWYEDPNDKELLKIEPLLIFLSKTKDVRIYIDRFVNDNEILYDEAMIIINCIEKNNIDLKIIEESLTLNKEETNQIKININDIENNKLNDFNTLNMMKNIKQGIFSFNNITRINDYNINNNSNSTQKISDTVTIEKNNVKSIKNTNQKETSSNTKIDVGNENENCKNNNNIIINLDKRNSQNKKLNIGILLRQQQLSKKRNIFRVSQKTNETGFNIKINKINSFNKNFGSGSFYNSNNLIPLVLPFSNTAKIVLPQKKSFINNNTNNNRINIIPIYMTKDGTIEDKKKPQITNLLEKFEKNNKIKNREIKKNINFPQKNNTMKIKFGIIPITNSQSIKKEKTKESLLFPKSNSINDFLKFNYLGNNNGVNKHLVAKTPNRHIVNIFGRDKNYYRFNKFENKNMLYTLIKGIDKPKTGKTRRNKNTISARPHNMRNNQRKN